VPLDASELISDADIERYRSDGVICLRGGFKDWTETLAQGIEQNLRDPGPMAHDLSGEADSNAGPGRFFGDYCNWQRISEFSNFVTNSPVAEIAARVMQSETAQIYHEHVLIKEPGTATATPWHQDLPYFNVKGSQTLNIWLTLDPVNEDVCPRFVAGSHLWGKLYYPRMFADASDYEYSGDAYETVPDIDAAPDDHNVLRWQLEPGDALLFNFLIVHDAPANTSEHRRRGFSTRWLGDDVVFAERPGTTSPPYPDIGLGEGDKIRTDWFPVIWPRI